MFVVCFLPESNGGNPPHESIGGYTLQVEEDTIEKQQQDDILTEYEAPSTFPNHWDILEINRESIIISIIINSTSI